MKKNNLFHKEISHLNQLGYSTNEMVITIVIMGILATLVIPNFVPALRFVEVLIAEKHLLKAVRECQTGLINNEKYPTYNLPDREVAGIGLSRRNNFNFAFTGVEGDCLSDVGSNTLSLNRIDFNSDDISYSLIIDLVTGEKYTQGEVPEWIDWWQGNYSPVLIENDPLLERFK
tara:strand:+ start:13667 stop:14188 length:522 start_codon:yes stop_codon:yes gene_type:complete